MAKMPDPLRLQHNVKQNAADIQSFIADLSSWEDGIKTKDKKLLKVRRAPGPLDSRHLVPAMRGRARARTPWPARPRAR